MQKLICVLALFAATACNGIHVQSPSDGEAVVPDSDNLVRIQVGIFGWELAAAGECGDREQCGHLSAMVMADEQIDATSWNGTSCGEQLDLDAGGSELVIDLDACPRQTGTFSVLVHLHDDAHTMHSGGGVSAFRRFIVEE